jgi:hypothetical protein
MALPPLALIAGLGAAAWGYFDLRHSRLDMAMRQLREHAHGIIQSIQRGFFEVDLGAGTYGAAEEYLRSFQRDVVAQIANAIAARTADMQREAERFEQTARLDLEQRQQLAERYRGQLACWDELSAAARALAAHETQLQTM